MALMFAGIATGYSLLVPTPEYQSSIKVLIGLEQGNGRPSGLGGEVSGLQDITSTMSEAVTTQSVAEGVVDRLDLSTTPGTLLSNISSEQMSDTQFIEVSYKDTDPERARDIANAIGEVFSDRISEISASANAVTATVWDEAQVPQNPVSPKPFRTGLLALIAGTLIGVSLTFLLEHLDDRWRSPEEVEQISGAPTFGVIPSFEPPRQKSKGKG